MRNAYIQPPQEPTRYEELVQSRRIAREMDQRITMLESLIEQNSALMEAHLSTAEQLEQEVAEHRQALHDLQVQRDVLPSEHELTQMIFKEREND